jgi:hypothetical protein
MSSKKETWKAIEFKGKKPSVRYAVSSNGRFGVMDDKGSVEVRSFRPQSSGHRYNYKIDGKSHSLFVHKEVARAFVKKPSPKHSLIIRKDHNYSNASADNLQWATSAEHRAHVTNSPVALRARKKRAIVESPTAKVFDAKTVKEVKRLIWDPKRKLTFKQIAKKYGVSEMQIYRLKSGELWYHIRVENEPLHKKFKENSENILWQEKKKHSGEKENKKKRKEEKKLRKELKKQHKKEKKNKKKKH